MLVVVFLDNPPQDVIDSIVAYGGEILTEAKTSISSPHSIYQRVTTLLGSPLRLELGSFLRRLRRLRDFTQAEVAERVKVARQTIYNWEEGKFPYIRGRTREKLLKIVSGYGCYREEADKLFQIFGEPAANDEEWKRYGKPPDVDDEIPMISSFMSQH